MDRIGSIILFSFAAFSLCIPAQAASRNRNIPGALGGYAGELVTGIDVAGRPFEAAGEQEANNPEPSVAASLSGENLNPDAVLADGASQGEVGDPAIEQELRGEIDDGMIVPAARARKIQNKLGWTKERLMQALLPIAREAARAEISETPVAAVAAGETGNLYLGANLQFIGFQENQGVHAEQAAIANAKRYRESEITDLAVDKDPCGHCRQFMNELGMSERLAISVPGAPTETLAQKLPMPYSRVAGHLLSSSDHGLILESRKGADDLVDQALRAANESYTRGDGYPSGVAIRMKDGTIFLGHYLKAGGSNPSVPPLQSALVALASKREKYSDIEEVVLVEMKTARVRNEYITRGLLKSIAPKAMFRVRYAKPGR